MDRADYIRQVDAMDLPDGLYTKLNALPSQKEKRHTTKAAPYTRWAAIAAALMLVVSLGVAAPTIIHFFATGGDITTPPPLPITTQAPAISDEELTELLAAEFPSPMENDTYSLLYSANQRGRTMGALLYQGGGHYVLGTIIVGVFGNETKAPIGDVRIHTGDLGEAVGFLSREQVVYLLWTNSTGRGIDWVAGLYTFSHGELITVTELPPYTVEGTLPNGARTMLDPERSADFWGDHKAVINGAGLDLYNRNPEYHYIRNNEVEEWLFACSIQFQFSTGPDVAKEPPELRIEGGTLLIRYPGETVWNDVLPMLPMPAERQAPAIDGLTSMTEFPLDNLYFGFTSPTEGWLALGGNDAVWLPYNYIYLTHDGGHTWVDATGNLNDQCTMFLNCAVFSDETHGFLGYRYQWGGNAPLFWTEDGGKSWKLYDMNFLPLPADDNTIYEPTDITFEGSEGTFSFTRHTRDDQGQPIETKLSVALTDYGTGIQFDTVPIFEEQLNPYSIKSSQLPYGDPYAAWMGGYETLPLRPLARLPEEGIDLFGFNENWCGVRGVLLVRDRDMSTAVWYVLPYDRAIGGCSLALSDYDGDGQDELAMVLSRSSGTGVAEYNLHMVELEGRGFRFCAVFDESSRPLILDALGELGGEEYDQFGAWQIYSLEDGAIHMELGVRSKDSPLYIWQGMLTADVGWDGETEMFSLKNAQFSKNE